MHVADDTLVVSQHVRSDSLDYFTERVKCRTQNYKASVIYVALEVSVLLTRSLTLTAAAWNHEFKAAFHPCVNVYIYKPINRSE